MIRRACAVAAISIVTFVAGTAHGASEADRLFQLGRRASEMGKWATACSLFRESQRLEPAVGTLINLGDCEEQQNHVAAALEYYQDALSRLSVTDDRMGPLRARIEAIEQRSGRLELKLGDGAPADTQVLLDGTPLPADKRKKPLFVSAGGHIVQVTAVGYRGSRQQVAVTAGTTKTLAVWPGPPLEATELALATDDDREGERERAARARARTLRTVGWVSVGAGVASLWVGSLTGVLAIDRESLRADNCDASNQCNRVGYDAAQSGSTLALVSTVTLAAGAVATAAGVWLVLSNKAPAPSGETPIARNPLARSTVAAIPLPSGAAAAFVHRF